MTHIDNYFMKPGGISCQIFIQDKCSTLDVDKFNPVTLLTFKDKQRVK